MATTALTLSHAPPVSGRLRRCASRAWLLAYASTARRRPARAPCIRPNPGGAPSRAMERQPSARCGPQDAKPQAEPPLLLKQMNRDYEFHGHRFSFSGGRRVLQPFDGLAQVPGVLRTRWVERWDSNPTDIPDVAGLVNGRPKNRHPGNSALRTAIRQARVGPTHQPWRRDLIVDLIGNAEPWQGRHHCYRGHTGGRARMKGSRGPCWRPQPGWAAGQAGAQDQEEDPPQHVRVLQRV